MLSFEGILMEAIDEVLASLGKNCQQAIYYHLEKEFKVVRREIPSKITRFTKALEAIFGDGAKLLEIRIMECLFKKMEVVDLRFRAKSGLEFAEYVEAMRLSSRPWRCQITVMAPV
jgi:hypothetical protein